MTLWTASNRVQLVCVFLLVSFFSLPCCRGAFCQEVPGRTAPTDLAVNWVDAGGKVPPQLMMRNDFCLYPGSLSIHSFLAQPTQSSPEAFLARYIQALPDTQAAIAYRDPAEEKKTATRDVATDQAITKGIVDLQLYIRYEVGAFTLIEGTYIDTNGHRFPTAYYGIHATSDGYRITSTGTGSPDTAVILFFETSWNFYNLGPHWNDAPKPKYQYSVTLPGPFPADRHPVTVFFNGTPSRRLMDDKTVPTDPLCAFVKHVVQVYRGGTQSQWLALWTPADREKNWNLRDVHTAERYKFERARFNGVKLYQVFTIDFGPNAVVFLADANHPSAALSCLLFWNEGASGYRLTTGVELKAGTDGKSELNTFDGNTLQLFRSSEFQKALQSLVGQPSSQKAMQSSSTGSALH